MRNHVKSCLGIRVEQLGNYIHVSLTPSENGGLFVRDVPSLYESPANYLLRVIFLYLYESVVYYVFIYLEGKSEYSLYLLCHLSLYNPPNAGNYSGNYTVIVYCDRFIISF